jgi:hypothetical protein
MKSDSAFHRETIVIDIKGEASEVIEHLAQLIAEKKSLNWTDLQLFIEGDSDWGCDLTLEGTRPETEAERNKRLKIKEALKRRKEQNEAEIKERELKDLARLKAKYG